MSPRLRVEYAQQQKERILETAYQLFAERGYYRTTMRELASRMGMTTGVLYTYFTGKDQVIHALAERSRAHTAQLLETLLQEESMQAALQVLLTMLADHWKNEPGQQGTRTNIHLLAEATKRETIRREAAQLYQETATIFTRLAMRAARRRELDRGVDPVAAGALLRALFLGLQIERVLLGDDGIEGHLAAIGGVLLRNIWSDAKEST